MKANQLEFLASKRYRFRKSSRVIGIREANHVILKARLPILRRNHLIIRKLIRETQTRFGIRIHALAIMENHIHFLLRTPSRTAFANALRFLAGQIALKIGRGRLWLRRC